MQKTEADIKNGELNYGRVAAVLKGIITFAQNFIDDENTYLIEYTTVKPQNDKFSEVLEELEANNISGCDHLNLELNDFRYDRTHLQDKYLIALKSNAQSALELVQHAQKETAAPVGASHSAHELVLRILQRFDSAVHDLFREHGVRKPLLRAIENEKDLQDVMLAFLRLHFDDIRVEEATPSHIGGNSFIDFLLKDEQIAIELKGPRDGLKDLKAGSELMEDVAKYEGHPDCKTLFMFVYDPDRLLRNPKGLISDLEKKSKLEFEIKVIIVPPRH